MKTMQEEWQLYKKLCYPQGCPNDQSREVHQAFFSGALAVFGVISKISDLPEEMAVVKMDKLYREVEEVCRARAQQLQAGKQN